MKQRQNSVKTKIWRRRFLLALSAFLIVVLALMLSFFVALKVGINSTYLAAKIQNLLNDRLGGKAQITMGDVYLVLDERWHLALESRDLALELKAGNVQLDKIGRIRIAVATPALLQGKLHIHQMQLSDVQVTLPERQGGNFLEQLPQDGFGHFDFDALSHRVFNLFEQGLDAFGRQNLDKITIERVGVNFPFRAKRKQLDLINLALRRESEAFKLEGRVLFDAQEILLEGRGERDVALDSTLFSLYLAHLPLYLGAQAGMLPYWEDGTVKTGHFRLKGLSDWRFTGQKRGGEQTIALEGHLPQGEVELADVSDLSASADIYLDHRLGRKGLWLSETQLTVDQVGVKIHGSIVPLMPPDPFASKGPEDLLSDSEIIARLAKEHEADGQYVFTVKIDDGSVLHPILPALDFAGEVTGKLETSMRKVTFDKLHLRNRDLTISGQGSLRFAPPDEGRLFIGSKTPEVVFDLQASVISIQQIKILWLFNVAGSARNWFFRQVETGLLRQGQLHLNLPLDFYHKGKPRQALSGNEIKISGKLESVYADLVGDLPQLENFAARLDIKGQEVHLSDGKAQIFIDEKARGGNRSLAISDIDVDVMRPPMGVANADMRFRMSGEGADMLRLIGRDPIKAGEKLPFTPEDFSGNLQALMRLQFPIIEGGQERVSPDQINWEGKIDFDNVSVSLNLETGGRITGARGQAEVNKQTFALNALAKIDEMEATINMSGMTNNASQRDETISLVMDDEAQQKLLPALSPFISGIARIEIEAERAGGRAFDVDLSQAIIEVPWLGWKKGGGVAARAQFIAHIDKNNSKNIQLKDFSLQGKTFQLAGEIDIREGSLAAAHFHTVSLNRGDDMDLNVQFEDGRYIVKARGKKFDMRSFIKSVGLGSANGSGIGEAVTLDLDIARVGGFYGEVFDQFKASFKRSNNGNEEVSLSARSLSGGAVNLDLEREGKKGQLHVASGDGGAILRFADYYDKIAAGSLELTLQLDESGAWHGPVSLRDFEIVGEPRLARIVASPSPDGKSLNDVTGGKINISRLPFDRAYGQIVRGESFLTLDRGIVRGPTVGASFQGVVYDGAGNIAMTGTFMPAYGLNRVFSNVPVLGNILGNGRDRGLIGITFKLDGKAKNPRIIVNPLSVIAPGVFRQIFEFHP